VDKEIAHCIWFRLRQFWSVNVVNIQNLFLLWFLSHLADTILALYKSIRHIVRKYRPVNTVIVNFNNIKGQMTESLCEKTTTE